MIDLLTDQPQTKRLLASRAGMSVREVELAINAARLEGFPVCSDSDGYWLGTAAEVRACAERLRSRALHQLETASALLDTAERLESPLVLWQEAA